MNVSPEAIDTWQRALHKARLRSPASFDQWFSSVQFDGLSDGVLGLTARDEFVRDWVKTHFLPAMLSDLERSDLERSDLQRSDLERSDLERSDLQRSDLERNAQERCDQQRIDQQRNQLDGNDQELASLQSAEHDGARTTARARVEDAAVRSVNCPSPSGIRVDWRISSQLSAPIGTLPVPAPPPSARSATRESGLRATFAEFPEGVPARSSFPPAPPSSRSLPGGLSPQAPSAQGPSSQALSAQGPSQHGSSTYCASTHGAGEPRSAASRPELSLVASESGGGRDSEPPRSSRRSPPGDGSGSARPPARPIPSLKGGDPINPKHTFPNFVVGPSNELAYAAAVASAGAGGPRYNPLFICGGTGLGKTHLAHSIAHRLIEERSEARVLYISAERFTNEFIEALQHHRMEEFRTRYRRNCDALLVDDIQFLAGREQTQEEFFHTFNALRDADKPIVVTSDKYPQELQRMPERLISRFTSGLVADVQTPALETRVAILRKKAALEGIPLQDDVAVLLAQTIKSNVRELEGALIRLAAKSSLLGRPIDLEFTQSELALVSPLKADQSSVEDIQRAVCSHFSFSNAELLSKDRHKSLAFARQVAMYLCRQRLKCSFPELGRAFGNRDHTTVMSACRRVESLRKQDPEVNAHLQAIEHKLASEG
jgi:chromosomal replication initiator protein